MQNPAAADDVVWVEDVLPAGATATGDREGWNWTSSNPAPFSGTLAHVSDLVAGFHQHYFFNATQTLTVNAGDILIAHVYLDPANPPTEVMLQFNDGTWEHRAYWGQNLIEAGTDATVSRRNMGALPPTGQWVRLEVPASAMGLEGRTLNGMAFTLFNGRATWDRAGKSTGTPVITISDVNVNEGNSGTTSAVFDVTLSSASTQTISVNYTTANSTAGSPGDYTAASGTVTFAPGETSKQITIAVVGDTTGELNESFFVNLSGAVNAALADNQGIGAIFDDDAQPSEVVWVEDAVPAGATAASDLEGWNWTSSNPAPFSGTLAHVSDLVAGFHQHYFFNATQTLTVNAGDILIAHVYLDPANPPTEVMLQFNDGTWEHRAYWGQNQIEASTDGTVSCRNMGALPPTGQWVRLEVPASAVGLEGRTLNGMAFTLFNGRAVWDRAGKLAPVIPTVSISDVSVNEGNSGTTSAVFTVTLSSASTQTVSISYATADGTATNSGDYVASSGTLTFDPGQTSKQITIPLVGDTILEANENFFVNLSNPVNTTLADSQGVGTMLNDDTLPAISINNAAVAEGTIGSGTVLAVFTVTLSGPSTQTISVNYATANGTATSPIDYVAASGTITFVPGQTSRQLTIEIVGDTANESTENYFVNLTNPVSATLADNQGVGTIFNDDTLPAISTSDATVNEGNSGTKLAVFNVTLSSASTQTISVNYATANSTASSPSDYVSGSGTVTFAAGQTSQPISIQVVGDRANEPNENFFVNLSGAVNATLVDGQGVGTILNDDAPPTISISDAAVNEGNSGTTSVVFNVTLSSASGQTISVNYVTANGTASSPSDYVAASGTVTFAAGQASQPISIQVVGDTANESHENFFVNLSGVVNATLADGQGVCTIFIDDSLPQPPQPLKHFGYIGAVTDSDLTRVRSYTNFTYVDGEYGQSMIDLLTRIKNNGMRAVIDLGRVLWCPQPRDDESDPVYLLCDSSEVHYINRWNHWVSVNSSVLNNSHVLAFSVITEPVWRNIPNGEVEEALALVKQTYPQIPTLVADAAPATFKPEYQVPFNADWVGVVDYHRHPNLDFGFMDSVRILKEKKRSWQRTVYALDGFYGSGHVAVAPSPADMDTIAQEWYTIASQDPEAILLGVFLWADLTSENAIGSISFPQTVLDKHAAIGAAIFAGRTPTYQGSFDRIDCQSLEGWAWDASQPNTPVSVDIYDGALKIATVRANQFRQDLLNAGVGNGQHGFTFNLPESLRNGQSHSIRIKYGGLDLHLSSSPQSITCAPLNAWEGRVEIADCNSIVGWAADRNALNTSITVRIYDGANYITRVSASDLRSDVGAYLGDNGQHGFTIPTPPEFKDGFQHKLRVKFETSTTELSDSPRNIACPAYYEIVARHSGKCLDVAGASTATGANVHQWTCVGLTNQQWQVVYVGSGYYKLVARHSSKVLAVQGGGFANGTPVLQSDDNGTHSQQWAIVDVGGGYYKIVAHHSGKALDVAGAFTADATQIHQWDYVGGGNQQWLLRPVQ